MISGLPERLKLLRDKYKYSQKNVAEKLHVSSAIISAYETGERTPSTDNILALSKLYHCSTDYLLGNDESKIKAVIDIDDLTPSQALAIQIIIEEFKK